MQRHLATMEVAGLPKDHTAERHSEGDGKEAERLEQVGVGGAGGKKVAPICGANIEDDEVVPFEQVALATSDRPRQLTACRGRSRLRGRRRRDASESVSGGAGVMEVVRRCASQPADP